MLFYKLFNPGHSIMAIPIIQPLLILINNVVHILSWSKYIIMRMAKHPLTFVNRVVYLYDNIPLQQEGTAHYFSLHRGMVAIPTASPGKYHDNCLTSLFYMLPVNVPRVCGADRMSHSWSTMPEFMAVGHRSLMEYGADMMYSTKTYIFSFNQTC